MVILSETECHGIAYTAVNAGYAGHCALECVRVGKLRERIVFPSVEDANAAACYAVGVFGGYDRANVREANGETPTHETWIDWI